LCDSHKYINFSLCISIFIKKEKIKTNYIESKLIDKSKRKTLITQSTTDFAITLIDILNKKHNKITGMRNFRNVVLKVKEGEIPSELLYQTNNVVCFTSNILRFSGRKIAAIFLSFDNILKALKFNNGYLVPTIFEGINYTVKACCENTFC